jgi:5-methylcytosine-specific restriction endonuclease McrA
MITHSAGLGIGKIDLDRMTIERMDNRVGHIKENCVLACWKCNNQRKDEYDCNEFYRMKEAERELNNI